jgi:hypothetical protein
MCIWHLTFLILSYKKFKEPNLIVRRLPLGKIEDGLLLVK